MPLRSRSTTSVALRSRQSEAARCAWAGEGGGGVTGGAIRISDPDPGVTSVLTAAVVKSSAELGRRPRAATRADERAPRCSRYSYSGWAGAVPEWAEPVVG